MRKLLLFSCLFVAVIVPGAYAQSSPAPTQPKPTPPAQTQTPPKTPAPTPAAPATGTPAAPRRPAAAPAAGRAGMAITVTFPAGATVAGVQVDVTGATERNGQTDNSGQLNFPGLQAGTYRLRFSGEKVTAFEKEVTLRAGQILDVDVTLNPAPEPKVIQAPAPALPPGPVAPPLGPKGEPITVAVVDLLEKEYVGKQPRRESLLSCSGSVRATMIQLNDPMPQRLYENADAVYYVLGGEGTIQMDGHDTKMPINGFASVPRGTPHSFSRRGSRSLVLLAVLSGEPCETAR